MPRPSTAAFVAEVVAIEDLGPTFRRITLGGEGMADFGIPHHPRDQRFKLIIPPGGAAPTFDLVGFLADHDARGIAWFQAWRQLDPDVRGTMRTYTVREWRDASRQLVVDMVLHSDAHGHSGPAARWAQDAVIGSRLHIIGPSRHGVPSTGGIGFHPGNARHLLLVGDETAVPAVASILDHLHGTGVTGRAILEVPDAADRQRFPVPAGIELLWLPRGDRPVGSLADAAVRDTIAPTAPTCGIALDDIDAGTLCDVPRVLTQAAHHSGPEVDENDRTFYAWIAGEASIVKTLRRYLVLDVGVDRHQIAFMGYWREGNAEGE